ncbi:uncharacterized protein LOC120626772 isoform X2 [Pararge aegeria]|nr:uncharacterized protein LOC120626772 isoform X2 [Pararge aegeria]
MAQGRRVHAHQWEDNMKRLWICVAFLAIYGNLALADDSDEDNALYDYDSYEYTDGTTKDNVENGKFRTTESNKRYSIQDYQIEDNRSELEDFDNAGEENYLDIERNTDDENKIDYLTTMGLEHLETIINKDAKSIIFQNKMLVMPEKIEEGYSNLDRKIFEDTKTILNEDNGNDFAQDDLVELNTEKTSTFTEILEETARFLKEASDKNADEESFNYTNPSLHYDEEISKETEQEDSVDQAIGNFRAEGFSEAMSKLSDIGDEIYELNETYKMLVNNITISEDNKDIGDIKVDEKDKKEQEINTSHPILYLDDALPATEPEITNPDRDETTPSLITQETIIPDKLYDNQLVNRNLLMNKPDGSTAEHTLTTPTIEDLSSSNINNLMSNFPSPNRITEITPNDIRTANNVWLTVDSPTVITSNNYPSPYPTNSVTDWMITGDGVGIELNITDLAVNGHVGDYVLFKPGGVDESGSTGLLLSYTLRKERRYRFLDVDKMFVRFEARPGPQVLRGFSFSVRMVAPRPGAPQPEPEPEVVIPTPPETITLNLGGVSLEGFLQIQEQFRQIVAQMAATYIINNNIDPGINTTLELTQITSTALCFHNWPKFEKCVEVRFGVPLVYEDDEDEEREPRLNSVDLANMWEIYSHSDPYVESLRSLGITEYQVPNDRGILTVWLVIAGGVVISMAMLAFALWRFSCFENYTRMPAFSDTESIKEKRNLDLYPTPHQTLPPLYTETDYNWADADSTKVDVRGYTNKSYMREDPYDLESDDDIVPVSARYTTDV